jgi:hypothetical protein
MGWSLRQPQRWRMSTSIRKPSPEAGAVSSCARHQHSLKNHEGKGVEIVGEARLAREVVRSSNVALLTHGVSGGLQRRALQARLNHLVNLARRIRHLHSGLDVPE